MKQFSDAPVCIFLAMQEVLDEVIQLIAGLFLPESLPEPFGPFQNLLFHLRRSVVCTASGGVVIIPCYLVAWGISLCPVQQTTHQKVVPDDVQERYDFRFLLRGLADGMSLGGTHEDVIFLDMIERCQLLYHLIGDIHHVLPPFQLAVCRLADAQVFSHLGGRISRFLAHGFQYIHILVFLVIRI